MDALGKLMAGLDHMGYLALEGTEVAMIVLGCANPQPYQSALRDAYPQQESISNMHVRSAACGLCSKHEGGRLAGNSEGH